MQLTRRDRPHRTKARIVELRIKDSVRLRLDRSDVQTLRERGEIAASTVFPGGRVLRYRVESSPASVGPTALFSDNILTVRWPETEVLHWASSVQASLQGEQALADGEHLAVLVEKNYDATLPHRDSDEPDPVPAPAAATRSN